VKLAALGLRALASWRGNEFAARYVFWEMRLLKAEGKIAMIRWKDADRPQDAGRSFAERRR
jgi:hypothetical protein